MRTGLPQPVGSATYNAANQILTWGTQSLTHDLNGNLTSDGTTTYAWDARNQLGSMIAPSLTDMFQYDAVGLQAPGDFDRVLKAEWRLALGVRQY